MAVHHPHLLDFSPPPNTAAMEPPPPSFDHGHHHLLALHVDGGSTDMSVVGGGGGGGVLATDYDTAAWPQAAVSLSLYNYNNNAAAGGPSSSLFGHHQQQFAAVPPAAAVSSLALAPTSSMQQQQPFQQMSSKYLVPVQELLSDFCSLQGDLHGGVNKRTLLNNGGNKWDDVDSSSSSGLWGHPSLSSMDLLELERRKARLLSMVEEVDRWYRRYREQMRAVEASFEAVAGGGAAQVYTRLALRAMSRHFRCLRDALVAQVRALRKAMGERDGGGGGTSSPAGATKGDTPRLKVLDQCLRQQRAFQQPGTIENYQWRPQRGLPERAVAVLRAWLFEHFLHPYPNDVDKHILARQTGLSRSQVSNWFINARVRLWKPMIEDMYTEEVKQQSEAAAPNPSGAAGAVKPESTTTAGGESAFRISSAGNNNPTRDFDDHHLLSSYPSLQGSSVSLTLGLQQQQQPLFASPMMMPHHQRSIMLHGEEPPVLDLTAGSQFLHEYDLARPFK